MAEIHIDTKKCNGCGACVEQCPVQAIKWNKERPFWTWKCESCMRCANICPERAIERISSMSEKNPVGQMTVWSKADRLSSSTNACLA